MKFKRAKKPNVTLDTAIIGVVNMGRLKHNKKVVIIPLILFFLIPAGYIFINNNNNDNPDIDTIQSDNSPSVANVDILSEDQLKQVAEASIDASKDAEAARLKAAALVQMGKYPEAINVYDSITNSDKGTYEDTEKYAYAVLANGNYDGAISLLEKAQKQMMASNLDNTTKQVYSEKIQTKIVYLSAERAQQ